MRECGRRDDAIEVDEGVIPNGGAFQPERGISVQSAASSMHDLSNDDAVAVRSLGPLEKTRTFALVLANFAKNSPCQKTLYIP